MRVWGEEGINEGGREAGKREDTHLSHKTFCLDISRRPGTVKHER